MGFIGRQGRDQRVGTAQGTDGSVRLAQHTDEADLAADSLGGVRILGGGSADFIRHLEAAQNKAGAGNVGW